MSGSITLSAPAKINLSLRILGKRSDGYHEIETLMAAVTLADEIEISHTHASTPSTIELICNDPSLATGSENLCVKAAEAFQKYSGLTESLAITLLKRIPHGAGLGGGSSNAAAVLRGMNQLFDEPLVFEELHHIAATIGSDVPFFLNLKPTWCRGRGELLEEAAALPQWRLLLLKPPFGISTQWAYQHIDPGQLSHELQTIDNITIVNDFEVPIFKKYLLLPVLKQWLQHRSEVVAAWMSGSGSTIVAALQQTATHDEITTLKKEIAAHFGATFWMRETTFAA